MIMFLDTETNGFIKDMKSPISHLYNFPRMTQLAYSLYNRDKTLVSKYHTLIMPDGWEIPKEKFFIENNHFTELNERYGKPVREVLEEFVEVLKGVDLMVAHNMDFDARIVGSEMYRLSIVSEKKKKFCTMLKACDIMKLPKKSNRYEGQYKYPSLQEAHKHFVGHNFKDGHHAMVDVDACSNIFFAMVETGYILLLQDDEIV